MASLRDHIMRARQAQVTHEQMHDVQLAVIDFTEPVEEPAQWATEDEQRNHWHGEFDAEWEEFIHEHYDYRG